ncbi:MAG: hypothetical protein ACRBBV_02800 [Paracoccaceae bacterium]
MSEKYMKVELVTYSDETQSIRLAGEEDLDEASKDADATENNEETECSYRGFGDLSGSWVKTAVAFFQFVPAMTQEVLARESKKSSQHLIDHLREIGEVVDAKDDGETKVETCLIPLESVSFLPRALTKSFVSINAALVLQRASLGALVSEYEAFLGTLLRLVCREKPSAVLGADETIRLADLECFSDLAEAKDFLLDSKVEALLHEKSHIELIKWLEGKFGVNLTSDTELIRDFVEVCQRRHLLTHAGGVVNDRYLRICREQGWKNSDLPEKGSRVSVDPKYIRNATSNIFRMGYFTLHILWQKLKSSELEKAHEHMLSASHEFLEYDLTKSCRHICNFSLSSKQRPSDKISAYMTINKALSYLFESEIDETERENEIEAVLKSRDWSIVSPTLALALACVKKEYENLQQLTRAAIEDGVDHEAARTWAVFREVRSLPHFIEEFEHKPSKAVHEISSSSDG